MKKFLLFSAYLASAFANMQNIPATKDNISKFKQIIDVRTPQEWEESGIIDGAKTIELTLDSNEFIKQVKQQIDISKPFAFICRSGKRSATATVMLDAQGVDVTNLDGGMLKLISDGYKTIPYQQQQENK